MNTLHLPSEIERAINSLPASSSTKANIRGFLTLDPEVHRAITKRVFATLNSKEVWAMGTALSGNPALKPLFELVQIPSKGLQYFIRWLAKEEQKSGRLTPEVRRQVLDVLNLRRL